MSGQGDGVYSIILTGLDGAWAAQLVPKNDSRAKLDPWGKRTNCSGRCLQLWVADPGLNMSYTTLEGLSKSNLFKPDDESLNMARDTCSP